MREASTIESILEEKLNYSYTCSKILFSCNSKVIDLVQVIGLQELEDFAKYIPKRIMSATLLKGSLPSSSQAKPYKRCIVFYKWMGQRKQNILLVLGQ